MASTNEINVVKKACAENYLVMYFSLLS